MKNAEEIIEILRNAECADGFDCPFGMFGKKRGRYGCLAKYPDGDPNKPSQGCIAQQAADLLEQLIKSDGEQGKVE